MDKLASVTSNATPDIGKVSGIASPSNLQKDLLIIKVSIYSRFRENVFGDASVCRNL